MDIIFRSLYYRMVSFNVKYVVLIIAVATVAAALDVAIIQQKKHQNVQRC
jgi:hypothetical protein